MSLSRQTDPALVSTRRARTWPAPRARPEEPDLARHRRDHRHRHLRAHRPGGGDANAGPAIVISMVIAGVVSALAGLCYAEFASTVPDRGIGLHLRLRDARRVRRLDHRLGSGARVRARRRDGRRRLVGLRRSRCCATLGIVIPAAISAAPGTAVALADGSHDHAPSSICRRCSSPRFVTLLLVRGVQESATRQRGDGRRQGGGRADRDRRRRAVRARRELRAVHPAEHRQLRRVRLVGHLPRRGGDLLRLHRLRRRLDRGAGGAQSAARHAARHPRIAGDLHGALRRRLGGDGRPRAVSRARRCRRRWR